MRQQEKCRRNEGRAEGLPGEEQQDNGWEPERIRAMLDNVLAQVRKPGRYLGGEHNMATRPWNQADVHFCLVFPDLYEIGMSHQGLQILYHLLNRTGHFLADRCYVPDVDMEQELRKAKMPLYSLEAFMPLSRFDVLGVTLPYELCYTNILTILDLAAVPLRAERRRAHDPLVIGGGPCAMNPEPVAPFFDCIALGDGEELILEVGELIRSEKKRGSSREQILRRLAGIDGLYVPAFFETSGTTQALKPLVAGHETIQRRVMPVLDEQTAIVHPLVPIVKPVHDRFGVEIARGCTRGCRFCQAGIIYRPVRERTPQEILRIVARGMKNSGYEELALLSLSTGDYCCLAPLILELMNRYAEKHISVSMPSMRVGTLTPEIIEQIQRVRKTGFTVAPEAGSERLRQVINKGISEEDLLATCVNAAAAGWKLIKFYFMIGLPTETDEDVDAIVELAKKARTAAAQVGRIDITISVATFIPKPHTPFQWQRQLSIEEARQRFDRLRRLVPRRGIRLKYHDPEVSFLEGVFARGDRRLAELIERVWRQGGRLDGWSEHFHLERWRQAAMELGLDLDSFLQARDPEAPLAWDHLHSGVDRAFLIRERDQALALTYTPDCRSGACQGCGLCDFKRIRPVTASGKKESARRQNAHTAATAAGNRKEQHDTSLTYRFEYSRLESARFYSHLEMLQLIFRALRRASIPVRYSQGFNPSPKVSFGQALPVGVESLAEHFDVLCTRPLHDRQQIIKELNRQFPSGIRIKHISLLTDDRERAGRLVEYRIALAADQDCSSRLDNFLKATSWPVIRERKGKKKKIDIRALVERAELKGDALRLVLRQYHGRASLGPHEFLINALGMPRRQALASRIVKVSWRHLDNR